MFQPYWLMFTVSLTIALIWGSIASAQCTPDGNDTSVDAELIGFSETVSDYVCPEDPIDYYYFEIPSGGDAPGTIRFDSTQVGTVFRLAGGGLGTIFEDSTTDSVHSLTYTVASGALSTGTYYIRVSHWSSYAYDHEYTITMSLTTTTSSCVPDNNEEAADADDITFGSSVSDYVCDVDHLDIWHFSVGSSTTEQNGSITLTTDPGDLMLYLYDATGVEVFSGMTSGGVIEWGGGESETLSEGDWYVGVLLPLARTDENSYTLELSRGLGRITPRLGPYYALLSWKSTWPSVRGGPLNTKRSKYEGPGGFADLIFSYEYDYDIDDLRSGEQRYLWPIVGSDTMFGVIRPENHYCGYYFDENTYVYVAIPEAQSYKPPCFDNDGNLITIHFGSLVSQEPERFGMNWYQDLPGDDSTGKAVEAVGYRIYVSINDSTTGSIYAFKRGDGASAWQYTTLDSPVQAVAEDSISAVYVQTEDTLYKFSFDGSLLWQRALPPGSAASVPAFGPIIGEDDRIWVNKANSTAYIVYTPDGHAYKQGTFTSSNLPNAVCHGSDGRLYIATATSQVICYDDWNTHRWQKTVPGVIKDMVMDSKDRIYMTYRMRDRDDGTMKYRWESLDTTTNGSTLHYKDIIGIPQDVCALNLTAQLAIGPDEKLVVLHQAGFLCVYGQPDEVTPSQIKRVPLLQPLERR